MSCVMCLVGLKPGEREVNPSHMPSAEIVCVELYLPAPFLPDRRVRSWPFSYAVV